MPLKLYIKEIQPLEDCFDGSFSRNLLLNRPLSREEIEKLCASLPSLYLKDIPRPFFRLNIEDQFIVKGIQGENSMEINAKNLDDQQKIKAVFEKLKRFINRPFSDPKKNG